MKLSEAQFCVECEEVVELGVSSCPGCADSHFMPLGTLADPRRNREVQDRVESELGHQSSTDRISRTIQFPVRRLK